MPLEVLTAFRRQLSHRVPFLALRCAPAAPAWADLVGCLGAYRDRLPHQKLSFCQLGGRWCGSIVSPLSSDRTRPT